MFATTRDLRMRTKELLEAAASGQEVVVTRHGRATVKIVPFDEPSAGDDTASDELFGLWADRTDMEDPAAWVRAQRKGRSF